MSSSLFPTRGSTTASACTMSRTNSSSSSLSLEKPRMKRRRILTTTTPQPAVALSDDAVSEILAFCGATATVQCAARVCRQWNKCQSQDPSLWQTFCEHDYFWGAWREEGVNEATNNAIEHNGEKANVEETPAHQDPQEPREQANRTTAVKEDDAIDWRAVYIYIHTSIQHAQRQALANTTTTGSPLPGRIVFCDQGPAALPGYPPECMLSTDRSVWCTPRGVSEHVHVVMELDQPCILTGFVAANGGSAYTAPLKEALVYASWSPPDVEAAHRHANPRERLQQLEDAAEPAPVRVLNERGERLPLVPGGPASYFPDFCQTQIYPARAAAAMDASSDDYRPVAAFEFPSLPAAYLATLERKLHRQPRIAKYVHFQLLTSHDTVGVVSDNFDVMSLYPVGYPLTKLSSMLVNRPRLTKLPEYPRLHG